MKKIIFLLSVIFVMSLSSCGDNPSPSNPSVEPSVTTHTVLFDSNGGSPIVSQFVKDGEKVNKPADPTKPNYTFDCWTYNDEEWKFDTDVVNSDIILFANWKLTEYKITYELNGGENNEGNPNTYTIEDEVILLPASKLGYTFTGWTFEDKPITTIPEGSSGNITLVANWEICEYIISYVLNGGINNLENPTTYTVDDTITLLAPSYGIHKFVGWTLDGELISEIHAGTTGNLTLVAHWDYITYTITYELNGGVNNPLNPYTYTENSSFELLDPTCEGYDFVDWTLNGETISHIHKGTKGNLVLVAHWVPTTYSITYELNGGVNNINNPTTYTIEDEIILLPATYSPYSFEGWILDGEIVNKIERGTTGNLTLSANWKVIYNVEVDYDDSMGTVTGMGEYVYLDKVSLNATPYNGFYFFGWYSETNEVISRDNPFKFDMPLEDVSIKAVFISEQELNWLVNHGYIPVMDEENNTVTYGLYPQSYVSDETTIAELNELTAPEANGWYLLEGEHPYEYDYYAKVEAAHPYTYIDPDTDEPIAYKFSDGTTIVEGATYWFKCEPITWNVLTLKREGMYLLSKDILNAHCYDDAANEYDASLIRSWLNNDFYNEAFNLSDDYLVTTEVDNSATTTATDPNPHACENTLDKVFLPSYQDYLNNDYGFTSNESRQAAPTDYALANHAHSNLEFEEGYGCYWTRSPDSEFEGEAYISYSSGELYTDFITCDEDGVRPAITLSFAI